MPRHSVRVTGVLHTPYRITWQSEGRMKWFLGQEKLHCDRGYTTIARSGNLASRVQLPITELAGLLYAFAACSPWQFRMPSCYIQYVYWPLQIPSRTSLQSWINLHCSSVISVLCYLFLTSVSKIISKVVRPEMGRSGWKVAVRVSLA